MSSGDGIRTLCRITGAAWDSPCGRMAGPMDGKPSKVNLGCLMTGERMPLQGVVCKDWGQLLTVEWGGKSRSPFRVAPGKNYWFLPISPIPPWPCLKRASSAPTAVLLQTEGRGCEQPVKCALLLKRKMCLDSLPNTASASLCTSVGEAEQQGGEDERTYQLTAWEPALSFSVQQL